MAAMQPASYEPRQTPSSVLVWLLREHLDEFLERASAAGAGSGLPRFVERQLRAMVDCGDLTCGFVRLECTRCRGPRVVPFSCKARLCPSCAGRRMNEQAAHLVDRVLPRAPYRQWVLTLPSPLARAVAYDASLAARVFGVLADELGRWHRRAARAKGISAPHAGCILEIQRFADGALLWPHAHVLAPDGVFYETETGAVRLARLPPPRDADVEEIVGRVEVRVRRLHACRAKRLADELDEAPPHQALLDGAALPPDGRVVGPRSRTTRRRPRRKRLCARSAGGLELHADVHVPAHDRASLERLCRYMARPAIAEDRLFKRDDGRIELRLKRTWRGGVRALVFEPFKLIARLAALIPLPHAKMRRFYGVFASRHPLRSRVVPTPPAPTSERPVAPARPARMAWADLLQRVWKIDALRCPHCGGRMIVLATIHDPDAITAVLAAVHLADASDLSRGPP